MNILIHTHNNHEKVSRLLNSIVDRHLTRASVTVVDGSNIESILAANKQYCHNLAKQNKLLRILYADQSVWGRIRSQLINSGRFSQGFCNLLLSNNLLGHVQTGEVRNICSVLALLPDQDKSILKLDDDMVILPDTNLDASDADLEGLYLAGSPDFSRLEWIQFYRTIVDPQEYSPDNYVYKVANKLSIDERLLILESYTDLVDSTRNLSSQNLGLFPHREEISGGAYKVKSSILTRSLFPRWYEEDWYWFNNVSPLCVTNFCSTSVLHAAGKKHVLDFEELRKEELGKIQTLPLRTTPELTPDVLSSFISDRLDLVTEEMSRFDMIFDDGIAKQIMTILYDLRDYLTKLDVSKLLAHHANFVEHNTIWQRESQVLSNVLDF